MWQPSWSDVPQARGVGRTRLLSCWWLWIDNGNGLTRSSQFGDELPFRAEMASEAWNRLWVAHEWQNLETRNGWRVMSHHV